MGYTFSRDASKYYYSANTFSIFTVDDYLMDFLLRDPIHHYSNDQKVVIPLGVIPLDYVRSLQIRVKYEHCANIVAGRDVVLADIHARLHEFANHLAPERAVHLNIEIVLMSRFPSATEKIDNLSCRLLNLYEAIRTPFYKLKHDIGVREIRITHHDEIYFIFPRNVTKVFQLSRMEWDYEKTMLEGQGYSLLRYINPPGIDRVHLPGFTTQELGQVLKERWGMKHAFSLACSHSIKKGAYWP